MSDIKRTVVTPEESIEQMDREGFTSVCCYGAITPEKNEIGGIFKNVRNVRVKRGLFVYDAECVERIFVEHQAVDHDLRNA